MNHQVQQQHNTYAVLLTPDVPLTTRPSAKKAPVPLIRPLSTAEQFMILDSLAASRAIILEDGPAIARKAEGERRMILNIEQGEVERVLGDVGGERWKGILTN